ncbi:hypothetical protein NIE79_001167 [Micromonospora sp. NIE79]|uniref:Tetratricopeptide repeat protein n=1 Tax=Micromonospora trifolii TaxID=2911208 RepID=A0ABS9N0K4_9ACTN|nr:hypothetical protein [Micromonospora trifolii]MCG5443363.1 hypothetical protein [Micromonospora trifolii]
MKESLQAPVDFLAEHEHAFHERPGVYTAGDLLSSAAIMEISSPSIDRAAEVVLRSQEHPGAVRRLAERAQAGWQSDIEVSKNPPQLESDHAQRRVAQLRRILSREPRNSIRWADLARAYATLGYSDSASRAMTVALQIGPINRFLLRAATRLDLYREDPDHAIYMLNRHASHLSDPWVLAAEIATSTSMDRSSKHMRRARKVIDNRELPPWHISELASALSAVELRAGRVKQARKLLTVSLENPTDNALAQAEWSSTHGVVVPDLQESRSDLLDAPTGYEARALYFASRGDYDLAVSNAIQWLADQPFAMDAAVFTSYTASVLADDHETAAYAAGIGLRAYPHDNLLLNNLAFACARLGRLEDAQDALSRMRLTNDEEMSAAIASATLGLVSLRVGNVEEGRNLYRTSVRSLEHMKYDESAALAALFWCEEELRIGEVEVLREVSKKATELAKACPSAAVKTRLRKLSMQDPSILGR